MLNSISFAVPSSWVVAVIQRRSVYSSIISDLFIDFCNYGRRALESNQYSHITATYFLLAERMLRDRQEKEQHSQTRSPSPSKAQFR